MKIQLLSVRARKGSAKTPEAELITRYLERASRYVPCLARSFTTEEGLLQYVSDEAGRTAPFLLMADSRGKQLSSEELARAIGDAQDTGTQNIILAIGPADGWSALTLKRANLLIAFGRITLPHELAQIVAAEQIYRALAIRAGHPYHAGH